MTDTSARPAAILKTDDLVATMAWYQQLGFAIRGHFPDDEPTWCELGRDGLVLQFLAGETPWEGPPSFTGCFYVHPVSVEAVHEATRDLVTAAWGPEVREWGARELGFQDPNGYFITFTEPA